MLLAWSVPFGGTDLITLFDLHRAVTVAVAAGGGQRVYFYAAGGQAAGLRHGFISVLPGGASCVISFEKRDNDDALAEIANLDLVKVQPLLLSTSSATLDSNPELDTRHLLNLIDPALRARGVSASPRLPAPAPAPAPATRTPAAATPLPASNGARHEESVQRRPSGIHLAHVRLQKQAVEVLEQLYCKSAEAKVVDLAGKHDPITEPIPFLNDCEQLASMLVGAGRAHELFMPLRNSLDA
ncbi:MAG: hypothetical protein J0L88_07390 [Xanthomonadales bacterium]|nr:hypothetical protein [Xanthomonadales bacterium]